MLVGLKKTVPKLSHTITAAISKLDEYLAYARKTSVYALVIGKSPVPLQNMVSESYVPSVINPSLKFTAMEDNH